MRLGSGIVFLLWSLFPAAQPVTSPLTFYTVKEGLSHNFIFCLEQDSRGFLWIGSQEGLSRFDGFRFQNYYSEKNNSRSLPNDNILAITEYRPGRLLIATGNGIGVLNTLTGQFENEKIKIAFLQAGSGNLINSLYKDPRGNIWVNHSGELDLLDSNLNYLYRFTDRPWAKNLKGISISLEHCHTDQRGRLWLPSDASGLHLIDFAAQKVYNSDYNPGQLAFLKRQSIRSFFYDEENNRLLYAPWGEGLFCYDFTTGQQRQELFGSAFRDESRTINSIIRLSTNQFLFYIGGQCYEMNTGDFSYRLVPGKQIKPAGDEQIGNTVVLLKTGKDQYWAGTTAGLAFWDDRPRSYTELTLPGIGKTAECADILLSRSGDLYCAYTDHLVVVKKNRRDIVHFPLPGKSLTELSEDLAGRLWVGTQKGVFLFDVQQKKLVQPSIVPQELTKIYCNTIYCDSGGSLWISGRHPFGLHRYMPGNGPPEKIENDIIHEFEKTNSSSRISNILEDKAGHLWMTSRAGGGILCFTPEKNEWKRWPVTGLPYNLLVKKGISSIWADEKGFLWLGNYTGDGLMRFDYRTNTLQQFGREEGLQSNYIRNICGDSSGRIWLVTEQGISSFSTQKQKPVLTIPYNGFRNDEQQPVFDASSNSLILAAQDKLLLMPVSPEHGPSVIPVPLIDKITVNNEPFSWQPGAKFSLRHHQKNIMISFTAVQLAHREKLVFAYRLAGIDEDWKYADLNRSAQYSILAPGTYTFMLKTGTEAGEWNPSVSQFTFTIVPPWWQTWWFRLAAFTTAVVGIFFLVRRRVSAVRSAAQLKQRVAETEMQALRAQMNPHFIFNCINSIDALIQSNDKYHATVYLNKFAKLIRNILDSSKQNTVPLSKDLETLRLYIDLEQFRNENKFTAEIKAGEELLREDYKVPALIIQPFVENAILHGLRNRRDDQGRLLISVEKLNGHLRYIVEDNGTGRALSSHPLQQEKKSYGIQMSKDRVQLFNQEETASVEVTDLLEDGHPAGTKVEVRLKIN